MDLLPAGGAQPPHPTAPGGRCPHPTRSRRRRAPLALVLALALVSAACGGDGSSGASGDGDGAGEARTAGDVGANPAGCVDGAEPGDDLFPDKYEASYAEGLSLSYEGTYKVLTVAEPYPGAGEQSYVLAQCGTEPPALEGELEGATVVEVPVRSVFSQSQSHLGFLDALGVVELVTGVSDDEFVHMPSVVERIEAGEVTSFATGGVVDAEAVIAAGPEVFVTAGEDDPAFEVLRDAGIPVMANAEWLETTPQGWADWIGFFAALTNTEAAATEFRDRLVADYEEVAQRVEDGVDDRPSVLVGGLYEGDWYTRGGGGIVPRFIADAGGDYVYADDPSTGSMTLDIEQVLADAADAEVWLIPNGDFASRSEALAADERYGQFAAWEQGGVWNNDEPQQEGVTPWEAGPVMIDDYLLDYVKILHPDLAPDHELVFFRQLPS